MNENSSGIILELSEYNMNVLNVKGLKSSNFQTRQDLLEI